MKIKNSHQGFSFISILFVLAIIGLIYWLGTKMNRQSPSNDSLMKDANIDTSSYKSMIDSARKVAQDASKPKQ